MFILIYSGKLINAGSVGLVEASLCAAVPNVLRGLLDSVLLTFSR